MGIWRSLGVAVVLQAASTMGVSAHEVDEADSLRVELNPQDYVPLAVGNRWTYEHHYENWTYPLASESGEVPDWMKVFEIPGYPQGSEHPVPPDSLRFVDRELTIEITHVKVIEGHEYYVFSDGGYAWPPLPEWFWGGKEVRLTDEGFLVFRLGGQDVPLYDFNHYHPHSSEGLDRRNEYTVDFPGAEFPPYAKYRIDTPQDIIHCRRWVDHDRWLAVGAPEAVHFEPLTLPSPTIVFLYGYGLGEFQIQILYPGLMSMFVNSLWPISASIAGVDVSYQDLRSSSGLASSVQSTSWGHLKELLAQ